MTRLTLALLLACGSAVLAQPQKSSTPIPEDLVKLLLRGGYMMPGEPFDIVLGTPDGFPPELLPRGAKPLIATASRTSMMVIAEAPGLTADAPGFDRQLTAAGWTIGPRSGPGQRGLLSGTPSQMPVMWCRGDQYASVSIFARPEGGSLVRVSVSDTSRGNPCAPMAQTPYSPFFADLDMPILFPPPGSRAEGGGGSGGGSDFHDQRLRLDTKLSLPEVLQHYRGQLEKHGWTYQSQAVADGIGVVRFSATSMKKEPLAVTVSVTAVPGNPPLEVGLRIVRAPYRPYLP